MLALALITLELETCCPDWLVLTMDLLRKAQVRTLGLDAQSCDPKQISSGLLHQSFFAIVGSS